MVAFDVVINGGIAGIQPHRFSGGSGTPERYETGIPAEIAILRNCQYASEVTEDELEEESEANVADPGEASPEAIESATLREKLLAMPDKKLRSQVAGRQIIKLGMNNVKLVDALLEHPEVVEEILRTDPAE